MRVVRLRSSGLPLMADEGVDLSDWTLWCPYHLEPMRVMWPRGALLAMLGLFNAAVQDERIVRICGGDPNTGQVGDVKNITPALQVIKPVCCFLDKVNPGMADHIVHNALLGKVWPTIDVT